MASPGGPTTDEQTDNEPGKVDLTPDKTADDEPGKVDTTLLTGAVVAVIGVVVSLTASGAMQRVLRNKGELLALALGVVVLGSYFLFRAALLPSPSAATATEHGEKPGWWHDPAALRKIGGACIAVGVAGTVGAVVWTTSLTERPAISASFDRGTEHLKATITAGGMATDDSIKVTVDGLKRNYHFKDEPTRYDYSKTELVQDAGGPDANGEVKLQLDVPIPVGDFDELGIRAWSVQRPACSRASDANKASSVPGAACVIMLVPAPRPSLTAAWEGTGQDSKSVKITAAAPNVRSHVLVVDVTIKKKEHRQGSQKNGVKVEGAARRLQYHVVGPGAAAHAETTFRLPVPDGAAMVCAEAHVAALSPPRRPSAVCPVSPGTLAAKSYHSAYVELSRR